MRKFLCIGKIGLSFWCLGYFLQVKKFGFCSWNLDASPGDRYAPPGDA